MERSLHHALGLPLEKVGTVNTVFLTGEDGDRMLMGSFRFVTKDISIEWFAPNA